MDLFLSILGILAAGTFIVAFFMYGQTTIDTMVAVVRMCLHVVFTSIRFLIVSLFALGWYAIGVLAIVAAVGFWMAYIFWFKPGNLTAVRNRIPVCSETFEGEKVTGYQCPFKGVRIWREFSRIDRKLSSLVVMLEDDKFYQHGGLDVDQIMNSIEHDIETKKLRRGASTITQQLAKNMFLTKEKSFVRKALEVPLAFRLEKELDKEQILELYLNVIEWGPGVYGVEAASRLYFDHDASVLSDVEAWLLALMIPNPKELNLWLRPKAKKSLQARAKHLAFRLANEHHLTREQADQTYEAFVSFIEDWEKKNPQNSLIQTAFFRKYPVRWNPDSK